VLKRAESALFATLLCVIGLREGERVRDALQLELINSGDVECVVIHVVQLFLTILVGSAVHSSTTIRAVFQYVVNQ